MVFRQFAGVVTLKRKGVAQLLTIFHGQGIVLLGFINFHQILTLSRGINAFYFESQRVFFGK